MTHNNNLDIQMLIVALGERDVEILMLRQKIVELERRVKELDAGEHSKH